MNLLEQAAADLRAILEDSTMGFARRVKITTPDITIVEVTGLFRDVHRALDPSTGQFVSVRLAEVVLPIAALVDSGIGIPQAVADKARKPWLVTVTTLQGVEQTFKICEVLPDELGAVTCVLEAYQT